MSLPLTGLLLLLATASSAQPARLQPPAPAAQAPGAPAALSETLSSPPLPSPADPCGATEPDYAAAFEALVKGQDAEALAALERVLAICPSHPSAGELARLAQARLGPGARLAQAALLGAERPTGFARGGLVVWQTLHGAAQGILLCAIANCEDRAFVGVALAGAAVGAGASWWLTDQGLTPGQSAAINSGTSWGAWYGAAATQVFNLSSKNAEVALIMSTLVGFTGAGLALALSAPPTAGQVSMANSGGLWAGVVTALFLFTADGGTEETFFTLEALVTSAGLTTFGLLSGHFPASRGRVLLIDAGGILGGLLGASAVALFNGSGDALLVGAGVGTLTGLGFTTWLTRDFDVESASAPQVALAPARMGQGAGLVLGGRF